MADDSCHSIQKIHLEAELAENVQEKTWKSPMKRPIPSMTYIYHKNQPNVSKYTIHGLFGFVGKLEASLTSWEKDDQFLFLLIPVFFS